MKTLYVTAFAILLCVLFGCEAKVNFSSDGTKTRNTRPCFDASYELTSGATYTVSHTDMKNFYMGSTYCKMYLNDGGEILVLGGVCKKIAVSCGD